jgi:glutamine amidotransferase
MIAIIDYGIGNLASVFNMLQRIGVDCCVTNQKSQIKNASHLILPGNGSFDACMRGLKETGLIHFLEELVLKDKVPILGICVGAQILGHCSTEGNERGLGWLNFKVERIPTLPGLRIPHMGWNHVNVAQVGHQLINDVAASTRFYFVHSYYMKPQDPKDILLNSNYGINFAAAVAKENIAGVQFHPEKSHIFGKRLLSAFASWSP